MTTRTIIFSDESVYQIPEPWLGPLEEKRLEKFSHLDWEDFLDYIREGVEDNFRKRTVMTKVGDEPWAWAEEYPTMASLAEPCIYSFVRFYLLRSIMGEYGLKVMSPEEALEELKKKKDEDRK